MGLFSKRADVPETISDEHYAKLQERARKAEPESMFSRHAVGRRIASNDQKQKRHLS